MLSCAFGIPASLSKLVDRLHAAASTNNKRGRSEAELFGSNKAIKGSAAASPHSAALSRSEQPPKGGVCAWARLTDALVVKVFSYLELLELATGTDADLVCVRHCPAPCSQRFAYADSGCVVYVCVVQPVSAVSRQFFGLAYSRALWASQGVAVVQSYINETITYALAQRLLHPTPSKPAAVASASSASASAASAASSASASKERAQHKSDESSLEMSPVFLRSPALLKGVGVCTAITKLTADDLVLEEVGGPAPPPARAGAGDEDDDGADDSPEAFRRAEAARARYHSKLAHAWDRIYVCLQQRPTACRAHELILFLSRGLRGFCSL
jgi:hypothetical protein